MNIYDEAKEELKKTWNGNPLTYPKKTIKALERAKKVEELVGLYQELHILWLDGTIQTFSERNKITRKIKQLEEELK